MLSAIRRLQCQLQFQVQPSSHLCHLLMALNKEAECIRFSARAMQAFSCEL